MNNESDRLEHSCREKCSQEIQFLDKFRVECDTHKNIYVIGLQERSVTLYNQQLRALNLIYCLYQQQKFDQLENNSIAIIGGGFSGMTAATAAAVLGVKVDLFEQRPVLCHLQGSCETRWVHPHIYDWPQPGSDKPYSVLPLLPWRAGKASSIIDKVVNKFLKNFVEFDKEEKSNITLYLGASAKLIEIKNQLQVFWDNAIIPNNANRKSPDSRSGHDD